MADLSKFMSKPSVVEGEWVDVGFDDEDQFRIKLRGFTSKYRDALDALRRKASRLANRGQRAGDIIYTPDNLPPSLDDECQGKALAEHCVLDIDGLKFGGKEVSVSEFKDMLYQEKFRPLLVLTIGAAYRVGQDAIEDADAAVKNLSPVSSGS